MGEITTYSVLGTQAVQQGWVREEVLGPLLAVGLGCAGLGGSSELEKLWCATHTLSGGESLAPLLLKGLWQTPEEFLRTWDVGSAGPRGPCLYFRLELWGRRSSLRLSWTSPFSPNSFSYGVVFSQNLNSPSMLKTWQGCAPIGSRIIWIFCPAQPIELSMMVMVLPPPPPPPRHLCIYVPTPYLVPQQVERTLPCRCLFLGGLSSERPLLPALPSTSRFFPSSSLSGHLVSFPLWSSPWFIVETVRLSLVCFSRLPFPQGALKSLEGQSRHTVLFLSLNPLAW